MDEKPITPEELLAEKSLFDVYRASRCISVSPLNQAVTAFSMALLSLFAFFTNDSVYQLADRLRIITDYGFSFSTSILSFLITGFTIYLTVTRVEHFLLMASQRHEKTGLPWVKYVAFSFLRIMAVYVAYCLVCVFIKLFGAPSGLVSVFLNSMSCSDNVKYVVISISFVVMGGGTVHLVMLLQSFIFNIYSISMTVLCLEIEKED